MLQSMGSQRVGHNLTTRNDKMGMEWMHVIYYRVMVTKPYYNKPFLKRNKVMNLCHTLEGEPLQRPSHLWEPNGTTRMLVLKICPVILAV